MSWRGSSGVLSNVRIVTSCGIYLIFCCWCMVKVSLISRCVSFDEPTGRFVLSGERAVLGVF